MAGLTRRLLGVAAAALLGAAGLAIATPASAAGAQTRYVAKGGTDIGPCTDQNAPCRTIRHAIAVADPGDTVAVGAGTFAENVLIEQPLSVVGSTSGPTTVTSPLGGIAAITISSPQGTAMQVSLAHLTVSIRQPSGNAAAVLDQGADLTVAHSSFSSATGVGLAAGPVDSQSAAPRVDVIASRFDHNGYAGIVADSVRLHVSRSSASSNGVPGDPAEPGTGLLLVSGGSAEVDTSTVANNRGVGIDAESGAGDLTVDRSTISGNASAGIASQFASTTVSDSTVAGNGGVGVLLAGSVSRIVNSTIAGTTTTTRPMDDYPTAGVAAVDQPLASGALPGSRTLRRAANMAGLRVPQAAASPDAQSSTTLVGTIVAGDPAVPDCVGTVTDGGYNLSSDRANSCGFAAADHSSAKADPKLESLADNGGPTRTVTLAKGSDAIDAIPTGRANCSDRATDQRGVTRPQGGRCDIGAVEVPQVPLVISPSSLPHGTVGTSYRVAFHASGGLGEPYTWTVPDGSTLPPGLALSPDGVLSGTPTEPGTYPVKISVDDPTMRAYRLVIAAAPSSPAPTGPAPTPTAPVLTGEPISPAATGTNTGAALTAGLGLLGAGLLLLLVARRPRGKRR